MKTFLLSFPRSGNSWFRYCIENALKIPTIDINPNYGNRSINKTFGLDSDVKNEFKIVKTHKAKDIEENSQIIFILRNFNDCVESHKQRGATGTTEKILKNYLDLLDFFDEYKNKKILIQYEKVITKNGLKETLKDVESFLSFENKNYDKFIDNFEKHKKISKKGYKNKIGGVRSKNIKVNMNMKKYIKSNEPHLIEKCLQNYM